MIDDVALSQALVEDAAIERALQKLQVSVAMATDYLTMPADSDVDEAGSLLVASGARCAVVVDSANRVVGILTHEAVQRALRGNPSKAVSAAKACEQDGGAFQTQDGQQNFVYPDSTLAEALAQMNSLGVRQLPVLPRPDPAAPAAKGPKGKGGAAAPVAQPVGVLEAEARSSRRRRWRFLPACLVWSCADIELSREGFATHCASILRFRRRSAWRARWS